MWASEQGHVEVVKLLIEKGAEVDLPNRNGETALMEASKKGHVQGRETAY